MDNKQHNWRPIVPRLIISFSLILVIFISVGLYTFHLFISVEQVYTYSIEYTGARLELMHLIQQEFTEFRRVVNNSFRNDLFLDDASFDERVYYESLIRELYDKVDYYIGQYVSSILEDPRLPFEIQDDLVMRFTEIMYLADEIIYFLELNFFNGGTHSYDAVTAAGNGGLIELYLRDLRDETVDFHNISNSNLYEQVHFIRNTLIFLFSSMAVALLLLSTGVISWAHRILALYRAQTNELINLYKKESESTSKLLEAEKQETELVRLHSNAKSAFLATMSHEIRTPLTAILGISQLHLSDATLSAPSHEAFHNIYTSSKLLLDIINDILDLSAVESGNLQILNKPYDLSQLIAEITQINATLLGDKNLKFILNINPKLPLHLYGDSLRLRQVLTNVLSNAFKYTDYGYVKLVIDFEKPRSDNDDFITLSFTTADSGIGMSEPQLAHIFDEYARFNEKSEYFSQGTGLGMSITKNLLDVLGGAISLTSEPNFGTQVHITLPQRIHDPEPLGCVRVKQLESLRAALPEQPSLFPLTLTPSFSGSVLVVDDVASNLYVASGLLTQLGVTVHTLSSGQSALDHLAAGNTYDLIFLDQMMPTLDGFQTLTHLRTDLGYTGPVIAFTANALSGKAAEYLTLGFDGYLSKPIALPQLIAILGKHLPQSLPAE